MSDSSKMTAQVKDTYIYDTEGHYTWHSSFEEALEDIRKSIGKE